MYILQLKIFWKSKEVYNRKDESWNNQMEYYHLEKCLTEINMTSSGYIMFQYV